MASYSFLLTEKVAPVDISEVADEEGRAVEDEEGEAVDVMMERRETGDLGTTDGVVDLVLAFLMKKRTKKEKYMRQQVCN